MSPPSSDSSASAASADCADSKRTAWSRIESEANPVVNESTNVMGADSCSWPALGESATKSATKSGGSASTSVPVAASNQMRVLNPNPNSKRIGSSPPLLPVEITQKLSDNPVGQSQESSFRNANNNSSKGSLFSPNSHGGSDHHQRPYKPFNRRPHNGGGTHNGGGRPHMHPPPPPPPSFVHQPQFIRPPPPLPPAGAVSFVGPPPPPPPPIRPFMAPPMGFPEIHSPIYYMAGPPIPPYIAAQPVVHAIPSPVPVNAAILKQIEYYFSNDNLVKDTYLRKHMDAEGWVPAALIAGFNRVRQVTYNISNSTKFILDLVQNSELVEVQGEKIRRRGDWKTWILPAVPDTQTINGGGSKEGTHG